MKYKQNIPKWNKDEVWNNIENRLHQKKKRRLLFWWLSGAAGSVLLIGFLMWWNTSADLYASLNKNSISKLEQKTNSQKTPNIFPVESPIELQRNSEQDIEVDHSQTKSSTKKEQQIKSANLKSNPAVMPTEELMTEITNLKRGENTTVFSIPQDTAFEKTETNTAVNKRFGLLESLPILAKDWSPIIFNRSESLKDQTTSYALVQKKKASTSWWIESGISIGNKPSTKFIGETLRGFNCEQFRFMQTNGIGLQRTLNSKWSLKLGLAYQTIYEKYECLSSSTELEEVFSEEGTVYHLAEETTYYEPGVAILSTSSTRFIIHNNFIHRLSVPLELAYAFKKSRWSLEPSLGFRFQFSQHFDGVINYKRAHFFDQEIINDTYYSQDLSIGLISSLNIKCAISLKGSLGLGLTYERDDIFNLFEGDSFVEYQTIGLRLGYYHSF